MIESTPFISRYEQPHSQVLNDKHPKSIRVACDRYMWVQRYKKAFRYTLKVWAHDEQNEARLGDVVRVQPLG